MSSGGLESRGWRCNWILVHFHGTEGSRSGGLTEKGEQGWPVAAPNWFPNLNTMKQDAGHGQGRIP